MSCGLVAVNFVGSVPSTVTLESGNHKVEVKASGGASWQRDLLVLDDSDVALKATLNQKWHRLRREGGILNLLTVRKRTVGLKQGVNRFRLVRVILLC